MYPLLVEPTIRDIMKNQLSQCNDNKFQKNTIILNIAAGILLGLIISIILYVKYKGTNEIQKKEKEEQKRKYILSKLNFYQKMKTKEFTNMPI